MGKKKRSKKSRADAPSLETDGLSYKPGFLRIFALSIILIVIGIAAYSNSFRGVFLFDDAPAIVEHPEIHRISLDQKLDFWILSNKLNYRLFGIDQWYFHAVNLAIHIAAALVLFGIVRRTLIRESMPERFRRFSAPLALSVAMIWMVHPLQTESVTYICQRRESLMGLFYLLTLYCVIRRFDSSLRWLWYSLALIFCCVGMRTKAVMVSAPLIILLYDRAYLSGSFRRAFRRNWGLYLLLAPTWLLLVRHTKRLVSTGLGQTDLSQWDYAKSQFGVITHYIRLSFWPDKLCLDYAWPVAEGLRQIAPPAIFILSLCGLTIWAMRRHKAWGFGGAWFFLILGPTSSFLVIRFLAFEHRMYLPLAGLVGLVVVGGWRLGDHLLRRKIASANARSRAGWALSILAVTVITASLSYRTYLRNMDYHSEVTMWSDVVQQRPDNPRAHTNLGNELVHVGRITEGIEHHKKALEIDPNHAGAHLNWGFALNKLERHEEALRHYRQAIRIKPAYAKARLNLVNTLVRLDRLDDAIKSCLELTEFMPGYPLGYVHLADLLIGKDQIVEAEANYRKALRLDPGNAMGLNNLAWFFATFPQDDFRDGPEAIDLAKRACKATDYRDAAMLDTLAAAYAEAGHFDEAVKIMQRAINLAMESGQTQGIEDFKERLKLYRAGKPFRQTDWASFLKEAPGERAPIRKIP